MKPIFLIVLICLLFVGCARQKNLGQNVLTERTIQETVISLLEPPAPVTAEPTRREYENLADGTRNWVINADNYGSSVENFINSNGNLSFSLNRALENPQAEQWTWSEIIYIEPSAYWNSLVSIEITYKSTESLTLILADSELSVYNPAAGFFAILPPAQTDTSLTLVLEDRRRFRQHDWVTQSFPQIRTIIDATTIIGIKIGTTAIGGTANAKISRFILNGAIWD